MSKVFSSECPQVTCLDMPGRNSLTSPQAPQEPLALGGAGPGRAAGPVRRAGPGTVAGVRVKSGGAAPRAGSGGPSCPASCECGRGPGRRGVRRPAGGARAPGPRAARPAERSLAAPGRTSVSVLCVALVLEACIYI